MRLNLIFLFKLIHSLAYTSYPISFAAPCSYPIRHRASSLTVPHSNLSLKSRFFLSAYSKI